MHGAEVKLRIFSHGVLVAQKMAKVPITDSDSIAPLDECASKAVRFTKCLPSTARQLPILVQFPFSRTQFGPYLRNIFAAYSVMRETFATVRSSIPVQLFGAAPG
jgi:hypothetical protein